MALALYRRKRDFRATPEPRGGRAPAAGARLSYVVQRHEATRLHYDFRLELGGALKSWAVPKGPSLDPSERRLAVHVEDHPLEYAAFEGEIPQGEYGAGTVRLWDRGEWLPDGDPFEGYRRGRLKFRLVGRRLRGHWTLVRMGGRAGESGKNWLLIKEKDDAAARPRSEAAAKPAPLPRRLEPQLATLAAAVPPGDGWAHEIKFDGYRIVAELRGGEAALLTRRGHDWTRKFPSIAAALKRLAADSAVLDGEIVVLDERGRSNFQALQNALSERSDADMIYYVFDLPYLDGRDLRGAPLVERKQALKALLERSAKAAGAAFSGQVRYSEHFDGPGEKLFRHACEFELEGVVSKLKDGAYRSGRSTDWLKVKCLRAQEFVIAGYTDPRGARGGFGALILGVREGGKLRHAGRVGTGFTVSTLHELRARLRALETGSSPFSRPLAGPHARGAHWVRPELVAEVAFAGWTRDGVLRQPSFKGLREDKPAAEVKVERPIAERPGAVAGVKLTHPDRILYPEQGLTKLELALYYERAAHRVLPFVARRPLALLRCPEGRGKTCFYQKHASAAFPDDVRIVKIAEKGGARKDCLYIEDVRGLVALVQAGVLEIHPWGSRIEDVDRPDNLIFDLDPDARTPWKAVIAAAREVRERLAALKLAAFLKTTGGKGLHVVVPLTADGTWPEAKAFGRAFAELMAADSPRLYTTKLSKTARGGRLFIDYLRNERGATAVAAYSTRARPGATVSAPIAWDELTPALKSDRFNVRNILPRLARGRDPWSSFEDARRPLPR